MIRTALRLSWRDQWLSLEALFELARARFETRFREPRTTWAALINRSELATPTPESVLPIVRAVKRVARHAPWRSMCLEQAAAGTRMLRRRGLPSQLHVGVRAGNSGLEAHAWVTVAEHVVLGGRSPVDRWTRLAGF